MKTKSLVQSVRYASAGIRRGVGSERNVKIQVVLAVLAVLAGWWFGWSTERLAIVVLVAGCVLALELMNTALESLEDVVHPDRHDAIRRSKDMAAGAVLVMSMAAAAIGVLFLIQ